MLVIHTGTLTFLSQSFLITLLFEENMDLGKSMSQVFQDSEYSNSHYFRLLCTE
jgi:hypothetical protein